MAYPIQPVPLPRQTQPLQAPQRPDNAGLFFQALAARQAQARDQVMAQKALSDSLLAVSSLIEKKREADMEDAQAGAMLDLRNRMLASDHALREKVFAFQPEPVKEGGRTVGYKRLTTSGWDIDTIPQAPGAAANAANTIDPRAAAAFQQDTNVPAQFFLGQNRRDVTQQLISLRSAKKQAEALMQTENIVNNLKAKWDEIKDDVGPVEGRAKAAIGRVSGGAYESKLAAYERFRNAGITSMRKLFNDVGAPSNFDTERFFDSIPASSIAAKSAEESWGNLGGQLSSGKQSLVQTYPLVQYTLNKTMTAPSSDKVLVKSPDGKVGRIPAARLDAYLKAGYSRAQ